MGACGAGGVHCWRLILVGLDVLLLSVARMWRIPFADKKMWDGYNKRSVVCSRLGHRSSPILQRTPPQIPSFKIHVNSHVTTNHDYELGS